MDSLALFRTEQQGAKQFEVRAIVVDGEPWFKGNDVAGCLDYGNARQALSTNVENDDKMQLEDLLQGCPSNGHPSNQQPHEVFINESGLYSLILRSKKPQAKVFKRWVTKEILPSIRKTGKYAAPSPALPETKRERLKGLDEALQIAERIGSTSTGALRKKLQEALDDVALPADETQQQYTDAETILLERGHTAEQTRRLAGELGKDLKLLADYERREVQSQEQTFVVEDMQINRYHRIRDARFIEDALRSFQERPLYRRVMSGEGDPVARRRNNFMRRHGRGRNYRDRSRSRQ